MNIWKICAAAVMWTATVFCSVRLIGEAYKARAAFRRELLEEFTARRLTLWPSRLSQDWIVEQDGIELARNEKWEIAIQQALATLLRTRSQ